MGTRKKKGRPPWFKVYGSLRLTFKSFDNSAVGEGFKAAINYFDLDEEPESFTTPNAIIVFNALKELCDAAFEDYELRVKAGHDGAERKKAKREAEKTPPPDAPPR